jgi:hypothetical protein
VTPPEDRVAVPTNGHQKAMSDHESPGTERETDALPTVTVDGGSRANVPAVSPAQLAAGFGIIAAVILLILNRRRSQRD